MKRDSSGDIKNNLAAVRERRGLSASELAKIVGVSRQAIYSIEAGTYTPNTTVSLRLARALAVRVEELFSLPESLPKPMPRSLKATLIASAEKLQPGQPVQLCQIDKQLIAAGAAPTGWCLPSSDAVISVGDRASGKVPLQVYEEGSEFRNRILMAGCDPAMAVLARHLLPAGIELVLVHQNSSGALALLKKGCVHIAGTHLRDVAAGQFNVSAIARLVPRASVAAISFATWEEGLITAAGNPRHIGGVEDLARKDIAFVNREAGAGSRQVLDRQLKRLKVDRKRIRGYDRFAPGHLAAAWQVKTGTADCCIATAAAARVFGLSFVPLESARYDLVIRRHHLQLPAIQTLLNTIVRSNFRRELNRLAGYDMAGTGERVI